MPKFDRKRLARGTKLVPSQLTDPLSSSATTGIAKNINTAGLDNDNVEKKWGVFRVNLSIPYIEGKFQETGDVFAGSGNISKPFSIPFVLPPLQDFFYVDTFEGRKYPNVTTAPPPPVILEEVSISVDQRAEPSALASQFLGATHGNGSNMGRLDFTNWDAMTMRASILSKSLHYLDMTAAYNPNTIWTVEAAYNQWAAQGPFVVKDIAKSVDPWKTLTFQLEFPDLAAKDVGVGNINIDLKFKHELVERDLGGATAVQNCPPLAHTRQTRETKSQDEVTVVTPATNTTIQANDAGSNDGISDNLGVIDDAVAKKFKGGIDSHGETGPVEELETDSGYFVMAVPMFSNRRNGGISPYDVEKEPYMESGVQSALWDRRLIPITHPMAIHHVILAYNWQGWIGYPQQWGGGTNNQLKVPQTSTFTADVGVGIATGLKGDDFQYEQVASLTVANPTLIPSPLASTWGQSVVDFVKTATFSAYGRLGALYTGYTGWDWDLLSVPLVGLGGRGYFTQGEPYYAGKSWSPTAVNAAGTTTRTNVLQGEGSERAPRTNGQEEWLEVRMKLSDNLAGDVASVVITTGGSGYSTDPAAATTGGSGSSLTVGIVVAAGAIVTAAVVNPGTGYVEGDVVTVSGGTGGTLTIGARHGLKLTNAASGAFTDGGQSADTFISGYQGHWVYIIGKKFLT